MAPSELPVETPEKIKPGRPQTVTQSEVPIETHEKGNRNNLQEWHQAKFLSQQTENESYGTFLLCASCLYNLIGTQVLQFWFVTRPASP